MTASAVSRRYARAFLPAMAAYVVVLLLSIYALRAVDAVWARAVIALLPLVPIGYAARALLHFVLGSDELQRRILLEAFALAALVLTLLAFALGLLAIAGVFTIDAGLALTMVMPAYCLLYGLFACLATHRYR